MEDLQNRLAVLEEKMKDMGTKEKEKKVKTKREPSAYNTFVANFIAKQKQELGTEFNHRVAFGKAAEEWNKSKSKA